MRKNSWRNDHMTTVDLATDYARKIVSAEARGPGDYEDAMFRLEAKTGIGRWTLWGLWHRRRKTVSLELFNQLRGAYMQNCERQLSSLQHELAIESAKGCGDDLSDLAAEVEALVAKIQAKRARR
jgi:hypothetical protein